MSLFRFFQTIGHFIPVKNKTSQDQLGILNGTERYLYEGSDMGGALVNKVLRQAPLTQTHDSSIHHFVKPEGSVVTGDCPAFCNCGEAFE